MNELAKDRESVPCELGDEQLHTHARDYGYTVRMTLEQGRERAWDEARA